MNTLNNSYKDLYLQHHGIKGMKWGVRRYQNPDGTLTREGKKRYSEMEQYSKKLGNKVRETELKYRQLAPTRDEIKRLKETRSSENQKLLVPTETISLNEAFNKNIKEVESIQKDMSNKKLTSNYLIKHMDDGYEYVITYVQDNDWGQTLEYYTKL